MKEDDTYSHELAEALTRVAAHLKQQPNTKLSHASLTVGHYHEKQEFLDVANIFPRPFKKSDGVISGWLEISHKDGELTVNASVDKSTLCRLVSPAREAVYECEPLLSEEEQKAL